MKAKTKKATKKVGKAKPKKCGTCKPMKSKAKPKARKTSKKK
jgi:hypothetical protein